MIFPYFPNVPNPPDDPADDIGDMQTNSGSINGIIAVDHIGFNVAGGGLHNQVTFGANNVPTLPLINGVLFTQNAPAISQLFYYSGTAAQSSDQYAQNAANGSTFMLGGIIVKWGVVVGTHSGGTFVGGDTGNVTFSTSFPNNCFNILTSLCNGATLPTSQGNISILSSSITTAGFNWGIITNTSGNRYDQFFWVALGN